MANRHAAQPRGGLVTQATLFVILVTLGLGLLAALLLSRRSQEAMKSSCCETEEADLGSDAPAVVSHRRRPSDTRRHHAESRLAPTVVPPVNSQEVLRTVRATALNVARGYLPLGIEPAANEMTPYLIGMVRALRTVDPKVVEALGQEIADDICNRPSTDDVDLMLYSRLMTVDAALGSPRALNCAFTKHATEDVVLWSLLDAWNASGREPLPALGSLARHATDERTTRRFLSPEEQRQKRQLNAAPETTASTLPPVTKVTEPDDPGSTAEKKPPVP